MTPKTRYERIASEWDEQGRPESGLLSGYDLLGLWCWSHSTGGKLDGLSPTLDAYIRHAVHAQSSDWIDDLCSDRESCRGCGEIFRVENLKLCTDCLDTYCHRCADKRTLAANGNPSCGCVGELVG